MSEPATPASTARAEFTPDADAARLTAAVARGDPAAFAAFYESWFDRAYGAARALTRRDEAFCLDVVQDAMLRVVKGMRPMKSKTELYGWMARTVRSAALDRLRRDARRLARERRRGLVPLGPHAAHDAGTAAEHADQAAWLRARLGELAPDDAALLSLRFAHAHPLHLSGAAAGLSGDAAHGRIRRLIQRLRDAARGTQYEPE